MEERKKKVKSILVTLPKPENEKNPYAELAKKHNLKIDFRSFIHVEGIACKRFQERERLTWPILLPLFSQAVILPTIFLGYVKKCALTCL